ncbi:MULTISPECIES: tRNA (guanosine(37)-N1)-methyltransferase TrmD [Eubacteriales]|jgi:tRNA (guanine37-N1)-methyltransferase|uniref:tRNA (guanosine(37)-N1)-methyltransferase TrmD n=1 Tax=Eubacteriales TaxID=186802 RepID=UPI000E3F2721|nr:MULTISPECIES: tRNA (guanosine(37)-N1)-methyltransferase TrmD [Eubacteriales]RGE13409.1 tRNA (guanosine(37)-N1)-methyltransferase TrmD [Clostridiaceae bacterium TF01-6]RJW89765.1 tRNA (guanosine(37)-N1)-methyltransferase TrmD [Clostridiales bacterium AF36-10]RGD96131.1 tRNA (guanosine(37)-N1)-methyltransferase TrmD [Clostridium sp. AM25-23AC]RGE02381.1 tRNA (guanosine(37)-N1)-methyltransferase TrmD [Clostridium sp. AF28-12]RGE16610.1 tRNA (guanosine(37)-N1)-methyltransferase TrmD [Desulfotom
MNFHVLTLFPEMIMNGLETSILGRAAAKGIVSFEAVNIRDYTLERHGKVDDYPYGGGAGMVMQAEPIYRAYAALVEKIGKKPRVIYMTPQGQTFNQSIAEDLAKEEDLVFLCGHYEGVDERVLEMIATDYLSAGDYVLTGGELPAMMMIDCISRLVPGVLNNNVSAEFETFHDNLLEYPQYTRPEVFMGKKVPDILLSGHHANVEKWRREQSIIRTLKNRPELLEDAVLSKKEQKFLDELLRQQELENAQKVKNKEKASAEHDGEETA